MVTAVTKTFSIYWWSERGIRCPGLATLHWTSDFGYCGHYWSVGN